MTNQNSPTLICSTCGDPLPTIHEVPGMLRYIAQCPRCAKVDELLTELLRRHLQASNSAGVGG